MKKFIGVLLTVISTYCAYGQNKLGNFYVTWGYHRNQYTESDIRFKDHKTDDYDFVIEKAKAKDRPDMDNLFSTPLTVPQYILNIGYSFANKPWGIEVSWDHLKYVITDNQTMHVKGTIRGVRYDDNLLIDEGFVHFEHTNGNNYLMISAVRRFELLKAGKFRNHLQFLAKGGGGVLVPKTESTVMGNHNDGPFRVSGFVIGVSTALRYDLFRYFYVEGSIKGAFADYTSAKVYRDGRATHHFFSAQYIWSAGVNIPFHK